jgi:hypothetical protein
MNKYLARFAIGFAFWPGLGFGAGAQTFDWSLLKGIWAESAENKFGCSSDNVHQTFDVSTDRKTLTFINDRKWRLDNGEELVRYSATIVSAAPNVLVIKYGNELKDMPDEYREWEMRFIGPGTYRWRATSWPQGRYNAVIGVKCGTR